MGNDEMIVNAFAMFGFIVVFVMLCFLGAMLFSEIKMKISKRKTNKEKEKEMYSVIMKQKYCLYEQKKATISLTHEQQERLVLCQKIYLVKRILQDLSDFSACA